MQENRDFVERLARERELAHTKQVERILYRRSRATGLLSVFLGLIATVITAVSLVATPPLQVDMQMIELSLLITALDPAQAKRHQGLC